MKRFISSGFTLGILGGGQLGKMLLRETSRLDVHTAVLDPSPDAPCRVGADEFITGALSDYETVLAFGRKCDVITIEIEHVNADALAQLESEGKQVSPSSALLKTIQNKVTQKQFYFSHNIPTAPFITFQSPSELSRNALHYPCVYKSATEGYDGRGVKILHSGDDLNGLADVPGLIEEFVHGAKEISVIVVRNQRGETACYDPVEMEFHPTANLVEFLFSPSSLDEIAAARAKGIAERTAESLGLVGILAVEMFVTPQGDILVNESAPRPHNSGHHTIESAYTSQYEQHLRAILGMPYGSPRQRCAAVMVNLLGEAGHSGPVCYDGIEEVSKIEGVYVHIYGKKETRPFRKMGHVTIIADDLESARQKAIFVKQKLKAISCKNQ